MYPPMSAPSAKQAETAWLVWGANMESSQAKGISCLVDTDVAIDFLRQRDYARALLEQWAEEGLLAISTLTHLEIYQGMKASEAEATNAFLDGLISIATDVPIARRAGTM